MAPRSPSFPVPLTLAIPSPQVCVEMGYALHCKRPEQIILAQQQRDDLSAQFPFEVPAAQRLIFKGDQGFEKPTEADGDGPTSALQPVLDTLSTELSQEKNLSPGFSPLWSSVAEPTPACGHPSREGRCLNHLRVKTL
jgi:hypothetical protein